MIKISLYYYRVDDILCEESEEVIEDVEAVIGYDALALDIPRFGCDLCIDYEVISINKSYAEQIHGLGCLTRFAPGKSLKQQKRRVFVRKVIRTSSGTDGLGGRWLVADL